MQIIDTLLITLGLDASALKKNASDAEKALEKTGKKGKKTADEVHDSWTKAAHSLVEIKNQALTVGALFMGGLGLKEFIKDTTRINIATGNLSKSLGISTQELTAWERASDRAGGTAQGMDSALQTVWESMQKFKLTGEMDGPLAYFYQLGVKIMDPVTHKMRNLNDVMEDIAAVINKRPASERATLMGMIGLDQGSLPLLALGKQGVQDLRTEMEKLGGITDADVQASIKLNRAWNDLTDTSARLGRSIMTRATPALSSVMEFLAQGPGKEFSVGGNKHASAWDMLIDEPGRFFELFGEGIGITGDRAGLTKYAKKRLWERPDITGKSVYSTSVAQSGSISSSSGGMGGMRAQLKRYGWSDAQIDGIMANLMAESKMNPGAVGDNGSAYGLGQWHPDRQAAFKTYMGRDIRGSSVEDQLAFLNYELTAGSEQAAGAMLRRARSSAEAAALLSRFYERPADANGEALRRASIAASISGAPLVGGPSGAGGSSVSTETHIGQIIVNTKATDADGIARDLSGAIKRQSLVAQADPGMN